MQARLPTRALGPTSPPLVLHRPDGKAHALSTSKRKPAHPDTANITSNVTFPAHEHAKQLDLVPPLLLEVDEKAFLIVAVAGARHGFILRFCWRMLFKRRTRTYTAGERCSNGLEHKKQAAASPDPFYHGEWRPGLCASLRPLGPSGFAHRPLCSATVLLQAAKNARKHIGSV